jgi:hypothetical protein
MEPNLLWELDLRRKRGHLAQGSGCLSAGVRDMLAAFCRLVQEQVLARENAPNIPGRALWRPRGFRLIPSSERS